ncbi:MAG: hypothetical protein JSV49_01070 [Thermoplasmata archaeon]|nr:MAG: hypothetical protein JSV49_01070 [Thermoplasmata archaeon]
MTGIDRIKSFVQSTLGCSCPEDVFEFIESKDKIEVTNKITLSTKINVGNRLLIYVIESTDPDFITDNMAGIVMLGKSERDTFGFNRFRLVVVTDDTPDLKKLTENTFNNLDLQDDKIHLHIINQNDYQQLNN